MSIQHTRKKLNKYLADYRHAKLNVREEKTNLEKAKNNVLYAEQAQEIVQKVAEAVQKKAHDRIASVVTRCLESVFGDDAYQFEILFEKKRGRTEAKLIFTKDGLVLDDPINESGGGAVDVAAFALRLSCLLLSIPKKRPLLVLDEPLKYLSADYRPTTSELLRELAKEMKFQFILVTHDEELKIGKTICL